MGSQSYLSVSDFRVLIGLGKSARLDSLEILWPSGKKQTLQNIESGKYYHLKENGNPEILKVGQKLNL